jgi:hypothetical protein
MRLYSGSSAQFTRDTVRNQIADKLRLTFFDYHRYYPSPNEVSSWRNSLRAMSQVMEHAGLNDHGVMLEYQLPMSSKRIDCLLCGNDAVGQPRAVIVELKQWEKCAPADGENEVSTFVGGGLRDTLHPAVQVGQYQMYLESTHTAFHEGASPIGLSACSYLHNYSYVADDPLLADKFGGVLRQFPVYTGDDFDQLAEELQGRMGGGDGLTVLSRIEESRYRPSKKLMSHVSGVIKGKREYVLLDEQLVVYDTVLQAARKGFHDKRKTVVIVKGGPGTGKSVIAMNLVGDLMQEGYNAHYATGSRAFTETLRKIIGTRGTPQLNYFNSYATTELNAVDVLICDEAHRLRAMSGNRFTPKAQRSGKLQIEELLAAAKVAVFFIDDVQVVRPNEVGSTAYIREHAEAAECRVLEYELEAQFRCSGSDGFVNWIDNTLGIRRTANVLWEGNEVFDFRIMPDPQALEDEIRRKVAEGHTGRVTAGFCWPWSDPRDDGTLVEDVVVRAPDMPEYRRPWNANPEARRLAKGIPKSNVWAYDPAGIDQVGCIYTAQGFEFDYVGVIVGPDITYDFKANRWRANKESSADRSVSRGTTPDVFLALIRNSYRVLLTRGMKGCYVYFCDPDAERFFRSRMENPGDAIAP